jgi:hypothetical protein
VCVDGGGDCEGGTGTVVVVGGSWRMWGRWSSLSSKAPGSGSRHQTPTLTSSHVGKDRRWPWTRSSA